MKANEISYGFLDGTHRRSLFCAPAYADARKDTMAVAERTLQQLDVVVSGRDKRLRTSTPSISVDAEKLRLSGTTDISGCDETASGCLSSRLWGAGGMKTVSLRGLGSQHTGVIYDGIMLSDVQTGQVDLSVTVSPISLQLHSTPVRTTISFCRHAPLHHPRPLW